MHVKFISASLISNARSSSCFMTSPHELVLPIFLILVILLGMKWYLTEILIYISLVTLDVEYFFMCILTIYLSLSVKCLFKSGAYFLKIIFYCWYVGIQLSDEVSIMWKAARLQVQDGFLTGRQLVLGVHWKFSWGSSWVASVQSVQHNCCLPSEQSTPQTRQKPLGLSWWSLEVISDTSTKFCWGKERYKVQLRFMGET